MCTHTQACFSLAGKVSPWRYSCPECGLTARGETPKEALEGFRATERVREANERERERVARVLAKSPDARTEQDEVVLAYSPYAHGQACAAMGFYLGSR